MFNTNTTIWQKCLEQLRKKDSKMEKSPDFGSHQIQKIGIQIDHYHSHVHARFNQIVREKRREYE